VKLFVCEYITGGGLYREPLPESLAREGLLMRDALLRDLAELDDVEVLTTFDTRLPMPQTGQALAINPAEDVRRIWDECIVQSDAVWLIAPETNGILLRLTELAVSQAKPVLGCTAEAVRLASSKRATCRALQAAGIAVVPTYRPEEWPQDEAAQHGWVAKPDDGAGCEDSAFFNHAYAMRDWLGTRTATHVVQPYMRGQPASLSVLCKQGQAWLLSCNLQKITLESGTFHYAGSVLNGAACHWRRCEALACSVAEAIPTLVGYIGIDILLDEEDIPVLEINPRLTTSYVGLRQAMGYNPARLIVDLLYNDRFCFPEFLSRNIVEIELK
jgi:predicted ATP-grasp superfamily ATP-dependent carboligase